MALLQTIYDQQMLFDFSRPKRLLLAKTDKNMVTVIVFWSNRTDLDIFQIEVEMLEREKTSHDNVRNFRYALLTYRQEILCEFKGKFRTSSLGSWEDKTF